MKTGRVRSRKRERRGTDWLAHLEMRSSRIHGRGLYTRVELPGRRKLGELSGRLASLPAARRDVEGNETIFLVELDRKTALDCTDGNVLKYLNHDCEPNCFLRIIRASVEVYTLRPIPAGTELTLDYGLTPHKKGMTCVCGSRRCRGRI